MRGQRLPFRQINDFLQWVNRTKCVSGQTYESPDDPKAFKQLIKKRKGLKDDRGQMPDQAPVLLLSDTTAGPQG